MLYKSRGWGREGEGEGQWKGWAPESPIQHTVCSTEYRIQNTIASKLMYIQLPMYLFFKALAFMILMGANPLLGPMEGVGPENLSRCHFRAQ
jgi:hypothetical protein